MELLANISKKVQEGMTNEVEQAVEKAIEVGIEPKDVLEKGLLFGMNIIGEKFKNNTIYVPEVLISARALNKGLEKLEPYLISSGISTIGTLLIGTVKGDLHDIGKNLVKILFEGAGFKVIDLGIDVERGLFVESVKKYQPEFLGMSSLLTTTMPEMGQVIEELKNEGLREKVWIVIGGAPVTQEYATEIGADFFAKDAASGVMGCKEHLSRLS